MEKVKCSNIEKYFIKTEFDRDWNIVEFIKDRNGNLTGRICPKIDKCTQCPIRFQCYTER
jgi:hypothetical protein